jgi:hypothetical protein
LVEDGMVQHTPIIGCRIHLQSQIGGPVKRATHAPWDGRARIAPNRLGQQIHGPPCTDREGPGRRYNCTLSASLGRWPSP